ncbi:MAG: polysaccharide deacetylase family protein [Clostridia bacterium]|nr:polysaccharide deacetylase family protein [Clostridia bacterium]
MHFCVIKSRTLKIFMAMVLIAVLLCLPINGNSSAEVYLGYSTRKVPIYSVSTEQKQVAISFDAAWGADKTQGILDILKEFEVGATFFLVGFWVDDYQDMTKLISDEGFEIGTHSNTHPDMVKLSKQTMKSELETSIQKIEKATGQKVELFRAPFGSYNNNLLEVAQELSLKTIQWDVDSLDWKGLSAKEICGRVMSRVKNGSIILMHNNSDNILDALRLTLNRLKVAGYKVTAISDLIYSDNYTIDRNGIQHKN